MIYSSLDKLTPQFKKKVELWLAENPEIYVVESWRSYSRQIWLYASGRSRNGQILTWTLKSRHTEGKAVDIAFHGDFLYPLENKKWRKIADSAKKFGIDWSWDLWRMEKAHFQDDGTPLNPFIMQYPSWFVNEENGLKGVNDAIKESGVTTDLTTKVGDMPLFQLLSVIYKFVKVIK